MATATLEHPSSMVGREVRYEVPSRYEDCPPDIYEGVVWVESVIGGRRMILCIGKTCDFWAPCDEVIVLEDM